MNKNIIGFDFSINKPAVCILSNNDYIFISWPYGIKDKITDVFKRNGVEIIERNDVKMEKGNVTDKLQWEINNAQYLSDLIIQTLKQYLNKNTIIAFEGLSYGSSGNIALQLGGYKYILMDRLTKYVPISNMYTYAPISLKKSAGCAKKGSKKKDMIDAFVKEEENIDFKNNINRDKESFMKKGGKNWIDHLDDFVDSYYLIKTYFNKEL